MYDVLERISKTVIKSPDKVAITDSAEILTYKQFDAPPRELARKLLGLWAEILGHESIGV